MNRPDQPNGPRRPVLGMNARKAEVLLRERGVRRIRWLGPDLGPLPEGFEPGLAQTVLWQSELSSETGSEEGEVALLTIDSGAPLTLVTQIPDFSTTPTVPDAEAAAGERGLPTEYFDSATDTTPLDPAPSSGRVLGNHINSPANRTVPVGTTVGVIVQVTRPI